MKKLSFIFAAALFAAGVTSCEGDKPFENPGRSLEVQIYAISDIATRVPATEAENRVNTIDVFLFDATSGLLEAVQRNVTASAPSPGNVAGESKVGEVTFTAVETGNKNVLAIANGAGQITLPTITVGTTTYQSMMDAVTAPVSTAGPSTPLVMSGWASGIPADGTVTLSMRRRVAKITVENLSAEDGLEIGSLQIRNAVDHSYLFRYGHPGTVQYFDYDAVQASDASYFYVCPQPAATNRLELYVTGTFDGVDYANSLAIQPMNGTTPKDIAHNGYYKVKVRVEKEELCLETVEQVVEEWDDEGDIDGTFEPEESVFDVLTQITDPVFLAWCRNAMDYGISYRVGIQSPLPDLVQYEYFEHYEYSAHDSWDTNHDGRLSIAEAAAVTGIDVGRFNTEGEIHSLEGIEYFTGLTSLSCDDQKLTELDLSNNTALSTLNCGNNQLMELDVWNNTELAYLNCSGNRLYLLNVSNNHMMQRLTCNNNSLNMLDISHNMSHLMKLNCSSNHLSHLSIPINNGLTELLCSDNQLTELHLLNFLSLIVLECDYNRLAELRVPGTFNVGRLTCSNNQLTGLDISDMDDLRVLDCSYNQITGLDMSNMYNLMTLDCGTNQLTGLDISNNNALLEFRCMDNPGDGVSKFPVMAWFDNNSIPPGYLPSDYSWIYNGATITPDYQNVRW